MSPEPLAPAGQVGHLQASSLVVAAADVMTLSGGGGAASASGSAKNFEAAPVSEWLLHLAGIRLCSDSQVFLFHSSIWTT